MKTRRDLIEDYADSLTGESYPVMRDGIEQLLDDYDSLLQANQS